MRWFYLMLFASSAFAGELLVQSRHTPVTHGSSTWTDPYATYLLAAYEFKSAPVATKISCSKTTNLATVVGATWTNVGGGSFLFNGSSDYILFDSSIMPAGTITQLVMCAWIWIPIQDWQNPIISSRKGSSPYYPSCVLMEYAVGSGDLWGECQVGSGVQAYRQSSANQVSTGVWTHVAMSYDSSSGHVLTWTNGYLSGISVNHPAAGVNPTDSTYKFYIGQDGGLTDRRFNGFIDDVRIYANGGWEVTNNAVPAAILRGLTSSGRSEHGGNP